VAEALDHVERLKGKPEGVVCPESQRVFAQVAVRRPQYFGFARIPPKANLVGPSPQVSRSPVE
jgi:hypothetical protein